MKTIGAIDEYAAKKIRPAWRTYYPYLNKLSAAGINHPSVLTMKLMQGQALPRWFADDVVNHWLRRQSRGD